jgi:hypothetical protein
VITEQHKQYGRECSSSSSYAQHPEAATASTMYVRRITGKSLWAGKGLFRARHAGRKKTKNTNVLTFATIVTTVLSLDNKHNRNVYLDDTVVELTPIR